jgi:O-antigen ligase
MLGPLITAMAITTYATLTTQGITFGSESNFDVTGGYGPNQVSSAMGLGILICLALSLQRRGGRYLIILAGVALWGTWATLLTFSRGGLYALVIAGCAMLLVGVTSRGARTRSLILLGVGIVGLSIMFSTVNDFSGNWLETRYEKSTSTQSTAGRTDLLGEDFQIFLDHPLFGVGVGESQFRHVLWGENIAAATHTEQTRILAEHGLLGVAALGLIVSMFISGYRHSITRWNRLLVVSSAAWALTTMLHAATRLGAVSLLFALSQLRVEPDPGDERLANLRSVAPGPSARPDQPPEGPTTTFSPGQTVSPLEHEGSLRSS